MTDDRETRRKRMELRYGQLTYSFTVQNQPDPKVSNKGLWNAVRDILRMGRN